MKYKIFSNKRQRYLLWLIKLYSLIITETFLLHLRRKSFEIVSRVQVRYFVPLYKTTECELFNFHIKTIAWCFREREYISSFWIILWIYLKGISFSLVSYVNLNDVLTYVTYLLRNAIQYKYVFCFHVCYHVSTVLLALSCHQLVFIIDACFTWISDLLYINYCYFVLYPLV